MTDEKKIPMAPEDMVHTAYDVRCSHGLSGMRWPRRDDADEFIARREGGTVDKQMGCPPWNVVEVTVTTSYRLLEPVRAVAAPDTEGRGRTDG